MLLTVSPDLWPMMHSLMFYITTMVMAHLKMLRKKWELSIIDGRAMGVGAADYDDDGFVDIYVANDHSMNYLWHNNGGKRFTDVGTPSGTAFGQSGESAVSMSVDFADYIRFRRMDMFISDDKYCRLYENIGNGIFTDSHILRHSNAGWTICRMVIFFLIIITMAWLIFIKPMEP